MNSFFSYAVSKTVSKSTTTNPPKGAGEERRQRKPQCGPAPNGAVVRHVTHVTVHIQRVSQDHLARQSGISADHHVRR